MPSTRNGIHSSPSSRPQSCESRHEIEKFFCYFSRALLSCRLCGIGHFMLVFIGLNSNFLSSAFRTCAILCSQFQRKVIFQSLTRLLGARLHNHKLVMDEFFSIFFCYCFQSKFSRLSLNVWSEMLWEKECVRG